MKRDADDYGGANICKGLMTLLSIGSVGCLVAARSSTSTLEKRMKSDCMVELLDGVACPDGADAGTCTPTDATTGPDGNVAYDSVRDRVDTFGTLVVVTLILWLTLTVLYMMYGIVRACCGVSCSDSRHSPYLMKFFKLGLAFAGTTTCILALGAVQYGGWKQQLSIYGDACVDPGADVTSKVEDSIASLAALMWTVYGLTTAISVVGHGCSFSKNAAAAGHDHGSADLHLYRQASRC